MLVSVSVLSCVCAVGACNDCLVVEIITEVEVVFRVDIGVVIGVIVGAGVNYDGLVSHDEDTG